MEIEITFADMVRATWVRLGKAAWLLTVFTCSGVGHLVLGENVVLGTLFTSIPFFLLLVTYQAYSRLDATHRRVQTRVDSTGVHVRSGASSSDVGFGDIVRVRWTEHVVLLVLASGGVSVVLTRGLDEESARTLRQAVESRIDRPTSVLKVVVAIVTLILVFVWLWTTVAEHTRPVTRDDADESMAHDREP
ncbi:MAG: hypothetical protein R3B40_29650 [Polyangiales bacterium]|nr:hypothetical protein [Sandaracinaceae bacterium]